MPDLPYIRGEIDRMRRRINRQRHDIKNLERAGTEVCGKATGADVGQQNFPDSIICNRRIFTRRSFIGASRGRGR